MHKNSALHGRQDTGEEHRCKSGLVSATMMYAAETCPVKEIQKQKMDAAGMRMLRWFLGSDEDG